MSTFLAEKRNKNKTILDWSELEAAVTERRRLTRTTPISAHTLELATRRFSDSDGGCVPFAQLDDRLVAVARINCIELMWAHTPPGNDLSSTTLEQGRAFANPGGGGLTCYKVCNSARGMFRNRWLPFNASDRETNSRYRQWQFAYGAGGMYRKGMGPLLSGIGPEVMDTGTSAWLAKLAAAEDVTDEWRSAAHKLVEALADWRDTFADTRLKFVADGCLGMKRPGSVPISIRPRRAPYHQGSTLLVSHCFAARLRRPAVDTDGHFELVPDLVICVIPQLEDLGFGPKAMYALLRSPPHSEGSEVWPEGEEPARLITTSLSEVLGVAREFSAAGVYIPA